MADRLSDRCQRKHLKPENTLHHTIKSGFIPASIIFPGYQVLGKLLGSKPWRKVLLLLFLPTKADQQPTQLLTSFTSRGGAWRGWDEVRSMKEVPIRR
eukprot:scaffold15934_cov52-Cyclotella_meneghiniana.AAC.13